MGRLSGTFWCSRLYLRSATIESHLSAISSFIAFHAVLSSTKLTPSLSSALKDAARSHAEVGSQATVRRPVSWAMLLAGETSIPDRRNRGRVLWLALCASFFLLTRASEMFAETRTKRIVYGGQTWLSFAVGYSWGWRDGREPTASRFDFVGLRATSCAKWR